MFDWIQNCFYGVLEPKTQIKKFIKTSSAKRDVLQNIHSWLSIYNILPKFHLELLFYMNGKRYGGAGTAVSGLYPTDEQSHLTLGKPNYGMKYFGRFQLNSLVFFYKTLSAQEINTHFTRG